MTHSRHKKPNRHQLAQFQQQAMMRVSQHYSFTGPLPPPEVLAKYNETLPGLGERIICMAEQQAKHRQQLETTVVNSNSFVQKVGPFLGFIVAMSAIGCGTLLVLRGKNSQGLAAILTPLAALVGVFIYGKVKQRKELDEKAQDLGQPKQLVKV